MLGLIEACRNQSGFGIRHSECLLAVIEIRIEQSFLFHDLPEAFPVRQTGIREIVFDQGQRKPRVLLGNTYLERVLPQRYADAQIRIPVAGEVRIDMAFNAGDISHKIKKSGISRKSIAFCCIRPTRSRTTGVLPFRPMPCMTPS